MFAAEADNVSAGGEDIIRGKVRNLLNDDTTLCKEFAGLYVILDVSIYSIIDAMRDNRSTFSCASTLGGWGSISRQFR